MAVKAKVQKWGNSLGLRIPDALAKQINVKAGTAVSIEVDDGRLVVVPDTSGHYRLDDLIDAITDENRHALAEFDPPRGREVW